MIAFYVQDRFLLRFANILKNDLKRVVFKNEAHLSKKPTFSRPSTKSKADQEESQAKKSKGRMPRYQEPKKDAESCEKPRGSAYN